MGRLIDLTKQRFDRLTVIRRDGNIGKRTAWLCECDCGNFIKVSGNHLKDRHTKSCGCLNSEIVTLRNTKHNHSKSRLYKTYHQMKARCCNPNNPAYPDYGGRGIKVCHLWLFDFMNFYNWAITNGYNDALEIDRINNNGNYEPTNCRWASRKVQTENTRKTIRINGHSLKTECRLRGLKYHTVYKRICTYGWPIEDALQ